MYVLLQIWSLLASQFSFQEETVVVAEFLSVF